MNQCVPSWDLEDNHIAPAPPSLSVRSTQYTTSATAHDVPMLDYEVAELTWENGHLSMHGLGLPRVSSKPQLYSTSPNPTTWTEKPQTPGGTLESIVNQATQKFHTDQTYCADNLVVPLINHNHRSISSTTVPSNTITTVDAIVPGEATGVVPHQSDQQTVVVVGPRPQSEIKGRGSTCVIGCSTRVGSCSGTTPTYDLSAGEEVGPRNRRGERGVARVPVLKRHGGELSNNNNNHHRHQPQQSVSLSGGSGTVSGWDSRQVTLDTCDKELGGGVGFTTTATTSFGSPGNTSSAALCNNSNAGADDHDSVCHSRPQRAGADEEQKRKSSSSAKRTRDVHNQSERKRRNKINQRMEALQKLVPNSNKTDKASMLDEVIEYLKTLKTQIHMMSTMSFPSMMMPLAMQQQLQMSMMAMAPMGMGMGMGMGMDLNSMARQNIPGIPSPVLNHQAFMPLPTWDGASHDRFSTQPGIVPTDLFSNYLACHSQPMTMDAYSKLAALYNQQLLQRPGAGSHS